MGYSTRVNIDHPPDSATAVEQCAGAFEHLYRLSNKRLNGCHVVRAGHRHIETINTILHDFYPGTA
jgi:hypothetical protein